MEICEGFNWKKEELIEMFIEEFKLLKSFFKIL